MKYMAGRVSVWVVLGWGGVAAAQTPVGTAFTYQGRLEQAGVPADGTCDFAFTLWDAAGNGDPPTGGSQIGPIIPALDTTVTHGLFTVELDFGNVFNDGQAKWLQVVVRCPAGPGPVTVLAPRQRLTAVPFAVNALTAVTALNAGDGHSLDARGGAIKDVIDIDPTGEVQIGAAPRFGAPEIDQQTPVASQGENGAHWQSFTAGLTGSLTVIIRMSAIFNSGQVRLRVYEGTGTDGTLLGEANAGVSANGSRDVAFGPGVSVTAGDVYTWSVAPSLNVGYFFNANDFYPGGRADLGPSFDFEFTTLVTRQVGTMPVMHVATTGRVGIGTSVPTERLQVGGLSTFSSYIALKSQAASGIRFKLRDESNGFTIVADAFRLNFIRHDNSEGGVSALSIDNSTGDIGIGTSTPGARLDVRSELDEVGVFSGDLAPIGSARFETNLSAAVAHHAWFGVNGVPVFFVGGGGAGFFAGNLSVASLTLRGGADIAEPFNVNGHENDVNRTKSEGEVPAKPDIRPGMIVAIDPDETGALRICHKAYDTTVAGIISGANGINPGIVLKQEDTVADGTHPVALTGRVWAYCDTAATGPIQPGDMLTTSDTPGHAMKATDRERAFGAILGKAMSSLDRGRGLVLVLVSLH